MKDGNRVAETAVKPIPNTDPDWPARIAARVGGEVRRHRKRRGMSAQKLADACAALGHQLTRVSIAKLETGLRETVTVADVAALARALNVAPPSLMFPTHRDAELLPGEQVSPRAAGEWFAGQAPFPQPGDLPGRWRVGRKVGRTVYRQAGDEPDDIDVLIGVMDTTELAAEVVESVNSWRAVKYSARVARQMADRTTPGAEKGSGMPDRTGE